VCTISEHKNQRAALLRRFSILAVALPGLWLTPAAAAKDDALPQCEAMQVPVSLSQVPKATLYGELCMRAGTTPSAVQLLVHGATYNSYYNDWPYRPDFYSYVRLMTGAGYATFNVERLGYAAALIRPAIWSRSTMEPKRCTRWFKSCERARSGVTRSPA
jgi:hypothetical protein